jgi:uncharacterized protein
MGNQPLFAVITGASRGIGAAYARALAARGYDLLLVARDHNRLNLLAKDLHQSYVVNIRTETLDLAQPDGGLILHRLAQSCQPHVSLLINNAGFGMYGSFMDMPLSTIQAMLYVHIHATTESTRLFLPDMLAQGQGVIINVASVAGFFPIPYMAEYAATKAFIISFSEAVAMEARQKGVIIQTCCPGYTQTDFHRTANHHPRHFLSPQLPDEVVRTSLNALKVNKSLVTIGWSGAATQWMARLLPQKWLMRLSSRFVRPSSSH